MLDGAARITDLMSRANELGQKAIATTDHGYLFGAYEFWSKATAAGVKPIIGLEAYLTPGTARSDRSRVKWGQEGQAGDDVSSGGAYTHATMWAKDTAGMHNLFRLASYASLEGHFYKARMDRDLLQRYAKGIIATTGCPSGEVQTRLRLGQYDEALKAAGEFQEIFGRENYYVELMDHNLEIETRVYEDLIRLSKDLGAPLVATNDLHYSSKDDAKTHEALLCIQSGSTLDEPTYDQGGKRFAFSGDGYYVKTAEEMWDLWGDRHPEALTNTLAIAEQCEVAFNTSGRLHAALRLSPPGEDEHSWFVKEVQRGLHDRFGESIPSHVQERANFEIDVIADKGYPGYFLVVADFVKWAKDNGIRVGPGRGSGAGSMAAYAMRITDLDPITHQLYFERFLNPERESKPDFDIDFDERRRGEVIRYVTDKYGEDKVAQIVTYGTIKAKQALKDSARVLGKPYALGELLTKAYPDPQQGRDLSLAAVFDESHERYNEGGDFRTAVEADPEAREVVDMALGLEGLKRQWGVHAAGVIMSSEPLIDIIPIMRREQDGAIITQFDYPTCEGLGLVKMDFLGLRNLTILDDALDNIVDNGKEPLVLEDLPLEDDDAFALLGRGDTLGVFQLDGVAMRSLLRQMKPDTFEDISAVLALYRPGPHGRQLAHQLRRAQERPPEGRLHPPRTRGASQGGPRRHLRVDRLPRAGPAHRADRGRLHAGRRRPAASRHGQEEARGAGQGVRTVQRGHEGQRLLRRGHQEAVGHAGPVRRLRVQQGAHRRVRGAVVLDRLPQGALPHGVHGGAAHLGGHRQGQDGVVPGRMPPHGHHRATARRQRLQGELLRRRRRHPLWPDRRAQRRRTTWWPKSRRRARRRGATSPSPTSSTRCPRRCATSARSTRS